MFPHDSDATVNLISLEQTIESALDLKTAACGRA